MKFNIKRANENVLVLIRKIGYVPKYINGEEFNCIKYLSNREYPRFHLFISAARAAEITRPAGRDTPLQAAGEFIKQDKDKNLLFFNLHLDQKKASYENNPAHSGEYEGKLVEEEKERIIKIIEGL
jgi:hypothetical protein